MGKSANINQITVRGPRGGMRRQQGRQNTRKRKSPGQKGQRYRPRTHADNVLAQGTGCTVRRPFGGKGHKLNPGLRCWDAKSPIHLALPRAVADYTIIRLTKRILSSNVFNMFGTFQSNKYDQTGYNSEWSNVCHVSSADSTSPVNAAGNYRVGGYSHESFGTSLSWTPSAISVQVMNGNPIGTTAGLVYAGVMSTQLDLLENTRTWNDIGENFLEFMNPRILSAGKLALRGVQANSRPFNMSEISDFTSVAKFDDGDITADKHAPVPRGWAPIVVYNPGGALALEYLVTTEYRVRFNIANPACASHSYHPLNDDATWAKLMKEATSMGNGIIDIPDIVASTGQAMARAYLKASM